MGIALIICGGRDFNAPTFVAKAMDKLHARWPVSLVIEGGAAGADTCGRKWAESHGIAVESFPADWKQHGKRAGHLRNAEMLARLIEVADAHAGVGVVAFPGGRGTESMVNMARAASGVAVRQMRGTWETG